MSNVSFYFNNYGDNGVSYWNAFDVGGHSLGTGALGSEDGYENNVLTLSGIKDLQFNNGEGGGNWYFAVPSIAFTAGTSAVPEPSTWVMLLVGFTGLGFAGYRASSKSAAIAA